MTWLRYFDWPQVGRWCLAALLGAITCAGTFYVWVSFINPGVWRYPDITDAEILAFAFVGIWVFYGWLLKAR